MDCSVESLGCEEGEEVEWVAIGERLVIVGASVWYWEKVLEGGGSTRTFSREIRRRCRRRALGRIGRGKGRE